MQNDAVRPTVYIAEPRNMSERSHRQVAAIIAISVLGGFLVRFIGAFDNLWLDELWSLLLVRNLEQPFAVFYGVSHDNNHFLNAFWLALVGPNQSSLLIRAPSVLLGVLTILAAARLGFRRGPYVAGVTALLFAFAYPIVHYGSEARGYAGLILAIVVAIDAFERAIASSGYRDRIILGVAIGFGTLSHLTMLIPAAIMGMAAIAYFVRVRGVFGAIYPILVLFLPSLIAIIPAGVAIAAGYSVTGRFVIGSYQHFSSFRFIEGYGGLLALTLGLSWTYWTSVAALGAAGIIATFSALFDQKASEPRRLLTGLGIVFIPAMMFAAQIGNTEFPRYFLFAGVIVLIVIGDLIGRALASDGLARAIGTGALAFLLLGHTVNVTRFLEAGRGRSEPIVARMAEAGPTAYISNWTFRTGTVIDHYAMRQGVQLDQAKSVCGDDVRWYVYGYLDYGSPPEQIDIQGTGCVRRFEIDMQSDYFGLSGWRWALYRRVA